jgi:predicted Ser/Thr protein kinase
MSDQPQLDPDELPTHRSGPPPDPATAPTISEPGPGTAPEAATGADASGPGSRGLGRLRGSSRLGASRGSGRVGLHDGATFAGRFEVLHELARGGMGVVYKARHVHLGSVVALKVMLAGSYATDEDCRRFILEAEAAARLKHPHIVPVHDIGEEDGQLYFTMDFVEGAPLSKRKDALGRPRLLEVMIQVADAISYAHQRGIIHRDLKPANIMMTAGEDAPLIMDFGLAKQVALVDGEGKPSLHTREGAIMGTPHYMPPEQAEGLSAEIDVRSDVYALGVILYELWTGRLPFEGRTISELLLKIFERDPAPPRSLDRTIDPDMEAIILKAIEKQKVNRYESAAELKRDLERLRDGLPVQARRAGLIYKTSKWLRRHRGAVAAGAALVAVVAVAAGVVLEGRRDAAEREVRARARRLDDAAGARLAAEPALPALAERLRALEHAAIDAQDGDACRALVADVAQLTSRVAPHVALLALDAGADATAERLALEALAAGLDDLDRRAERAVAVAAQLREAERRVVEVRERQARAVAGLATTATAGVAVAPPTLAAALEAWRELPTERPRDVPDDEAFAEVRPALEDASAAVFALLNLAAEETPARARAPELVSELATLRADLDEAGRSAERTRLAQRLRGAAAAVLELLAAERARGARGPEVRRQLLAAAVLAQALVQRTSELAPALGDALRPRASRAYGEVLLDLRAYDVFDAQLDLLAPADRAALEARREAELRATDELAARIEALAAAPAGAAVEELDDRLRELGELAAGELPLEVRTAIEDAIGRVEGTRDRLLLQGLYEAIEAAERRARAPEAVLAPDDADRELARAEALLDARRGLFEPRALDAARARCRSARGDTRRPRRDRRSCARRPRSTSTTRSAGSTCSAPTTRATSTSTSGSRSAASSPRSPIDTRRSALRPPWPTPCLPSTRSRRRPGARQPPRPTRS